MICPNCGEEIGNATMCNKCGAVISGDGDSGLETGVSKNDEVEIDVQVGTGGCPNCGSSNIAFRRENLGEVREKKSKRIIHQTVGYCKDCGHTWYPGNTGQPTQKRKTWLWVLGWLFIFPLPLTILMLRKKDMKPVIKYGVIALAWAAYLLIGIGGASGTDSDTDANAPTTVVEEESDADKNSGSEEPAATETSKNVSDEFIVDYLNTQQDWSGTWEAKGDGFFVFYPEGDLAEAFNTMTAYYALNGEIPAELKDSYNSMKDSMGRLSSSVQKVSGSACSLSIANPANKENVLMTFMSGACIYSAFEE